MQYKVKVREVYEIERYYFVEADSKSDAKRVAKNGDWYDAHDTEIGDYGLIRIKIKSVKENKYCVVFCITSNLGEIKVSNFVAKVLYFHGLAFMLSLILVAVLSLAFVGAHLIKDAIFSN